MKNVHPRIPWNKGKLIGQKSPLKLREIWAIRNYLELGRRLRDLGSSIWASTASYAVVT